MAKPLTETQLAVLEEVVQRGGIVIPGDVKDIAIAADVSESYVTQLLNPETSYGARFKVELDARLARLPLARPDMQVAYLQRMLDEKLQRRRERGLELSNEDPVKIIDIARRITQPTGGVTINNVQAQQQIFDLGALSDTDLRAKIEQLQRAIDAKHLTIESVIDLDDAE